MYLGLIYMLHARLLGSFIVRLTKQAKCVRYRHSPKALAVSVTSFQALFLFIMSLHVSWDVTWQELKKLQTSLSIGLVQGIVWICHALSYLICIGIPYTWWTPLFYVLILVFTTCPSFYKVYVVVQAGKVIELYHNTRSKYFSSEQTVALYVNVLE